ncbi:heparin-binding hemagglutinin [Tsukamurella sp. 8F]|uniref:heparin-binding hemagglutinin n=1 Tax=unclassified Tsukamurella TaxID=2633480 RepID=UPI0023B92A04|nr:MULTISPECIES: heparin-binding hemagglutinin [unclassified Tsukamurella]MDF0528310.1 heparin-binding hemagglutinin [Tsukamurella sp. 8J]MDF0589508.1 heparin-binding hemagglutinin [Tsukamurella sp. 8F]
MTEIKADDIRTPLFAALGAGDYAFEAVSEVVEKLRAAATDASTDFQGKVTEAQAKVNEAREGAEARYTEAKGSLPKDVDELRAKFSSDELRKVAAAYIQVATEIYESLAERGESAYEKIKSQSVVEDATEQATKAYNSAVELTESSLGQVASATRQVGERAAKLVGRSADEAADTADDAAAKVAGAAAE